MNLSHLNVIAASPCVFPMQIILFLSNCPVECEENFFGKSNPAPKPDVSSMSPEQFVKQCDDIKNFVTMSSDEYHR